MVMSCVCVGFFVQIVFGPAYSCVDSSGFFVTVKQEDFAFAVCHEGINRSQVSLDTGLGVKFLGLGLAIVFSEIENGAQNLD